MCFHVTAAVVGDYFWPKINAQQALIYSSVFIAIQEHVTRGNGVTDVLLIGFGWKQNTLTKMNTHQHSVPLVALRNKCASENIKSGLQYQRSSVLYIYKGYNSDLFWNQPSTVPPSLTSKKKKKKKGFILALCFYCSLLGGSEIHTTYVPSKQCPSICEFFLTWSFLMTSNRTEENQQKKTAI